jgi:tetratricopeptide (TPR) repeat protein
MKRIIAYFDPARDGFIRRMLRLIGLGLGAIGLLGCLGLFLLGRRHDAQLRYWVGVLQLQTGRNESALQTAEALVDRYPDRSWYDHRLLATALRREGRIEDQLRVIRQGSERFPDDWRPQGDLCWYGTLFDSPEAVMEACERAVLLSPDGRANAHSRRGVARALTGDREGAIEDLREAVSRWDERGRKGYFVDSRRAWLEALESGQDPFDEDLMEMLRRQF